MASDSLDIRRLLVAVLSLLWASVAGNSDAPLSPIWIDKKLTLERVARRKRWGSPDRDCSA